MHGKGFLLPCANVEVPLDQALRDDWNIERYLVPRAKKADLRYDLYRLGIHSSSLFPDVDGPAARIRWHIASCHRKAMQSVAQVLDRPYRPTFPFAHVTVPAHGAFG